ncbi:MAG: amidohydrolase [Raineya sp.]|jgi:predicted amidohydrolase|nr:amidohydrolase [Raineya sp.]
MDNLYTTIIQTDLYWENPTANLAMLEEKMEEITQPTDLIVLPEMFTTGFTMNASAFAEPMNLTTCKWLQQQAKKKNAVVVGSCIIKEKEQYYNRFLWVEPDGKIDFYDKRHLFRMAGEHEVYTQGNKRIIKNIKGWNIFPLICYDLRFPVWARNINLAYDVVLYVANWPNPRLNAWDTLLQARAIENQVYSVGLNRVGTDAKGNEYNGNSAVYDFKGNKVVKIENGEEKIVNVLLEKAPLEDFRTKFPIYLDADTITENLNTFF